MSPKQSKEIKNKEKIIKNKTENYSQVYDTLFQLKKFAPKLPEIYYHDYDLKNINKINNESYGEIHKGKIPNIFFGHFFVKKEKSCIKSCITQRNKKKLITILYYRP